MLESWKIRKIMLLPNVPYPLSFNQWGPISLMGEYTSYFLRSLLIGYKYLPLIIHKAQYRFRLGTHIK